MCDDDPSRNSLFRSRPMSYVSITAMTDIAYDTIRELGNFGLFHVVDLNAGKEASVNDKNLAGYKKRVQDCMMYERKLHDLEEQIKEYNIPLPPPLREHEDRRHTHKDNAVLPDIRANLEPLEERLRRSVQVQAEITRAISELTERVWVYKTCRNMQVGRVEAHDDKHEVPYSAAAAAVPGAILVPGTTAAGLPAAAAAAAPAPPPKQNKDVELGERPVGTPPGTTGTGGDSKLNQLGVSLLSADHHAPSGAPGGGAAAKFILPNFRTTLTGVLPTDKSAFFQRMLYRISRGNAITNFSDIPVPIPDAVTGELVNKSVFSVIIVVSELLEKRITKVCQLFQATLVRMPYTQAAIDEALHRAEAQIDEQRMLKVNTLRDIEQALRQLAGDPHNVSPLREWQYLLRCEKAVCDTMMRCHFYLTMVAFEGWCPVEEVDNLKLAIKRAVPPGDKIPEPAVEVAPAHPIRDPGMPPTYFKLNKFTSIFQGIVNTYGVPRYQEVNPGLFTIVTFPFLFGVMYGDIGHGTFVTILSLLMIIFEDRLTRLKESGNMNEIFRMCFGGRYLLVCMGVMGIYCGTLYNDCMSIPVSLYAPTWEYEGTAEEPATRIGAVYPYGVDPAWYHTKNQLTFFNGMKMKTSVILGVTQMTFGIVMGLLNHIHFRDQISIWLEFLPQLLFMLCTFGYMCILIIIKWCTDWSQTSQEPPNLIQTMITMFLGLGGVKEGAQLYSGQSTVQAILLIIAFGSIPVMLLAKPCILAYCSKDDGHGHGHAKPQAAQPAAAAAGHVDAEAKGFDEKGEVIPAEAPAAGAGAAHEEEHTFGDYMIHQSIHTIEFVLGTVSNTASYLRLWALSLAHSELADVFWTKLILEYGMYKNSAFFSMVAVAVWFVMTAGVLLSMDVLECFLHALRLHWVEFQNKFFHADGYAFKPFSYDIIDDS